MKQYIFLFLLFVAPPIWAQQVLVEPYLQNPTPSSIWICWETRLGDDGRVEWGLTEELGQVTEGQAAHVHIASRHHKIQLTNLQADTRYHYRVITGDYTSATFHFKTPPTTDSEAAFRLVAMSDMQQDLLNIDRYREIIEDGVVSYMTAQFGADLAAELGLVLIPGDLVPDGRLYGSWANAFFTPGRQLMPYVPFMPVPGNHEHDSQYYFDYFHLPNNGTPGFEEHWWYTDYSNVRIIGLDSNGGYRIPEQLQWLDQVLADACAADHVDFVFAQLHHPHESELWPAGNLSYTGEVIERMENFSTDCTKPSVHFFGHTHGYSRGQSRDHRHLMVNVATAGGNIDYWGEYNQIDYAQYTVSQAEYGFVLVEVEAGEMPRFRLSRIGRGDENNRQDNVVRDALEVRLNNEPPRSPLIRSALPARVDPDCFTLGTRGFRDSDGDSHQATHWQISRSCEDFSDVVVDRWTQSQNIFDGADQQADDDLTDEVIEGLMPMTDYCWRARFRDTGFTWSPWSTPEAFQTGASDQHPLPLLNGDAEDGTAHWQIEDGTFEALANDQCDGGAAHGGAHFFSVGGACDSSAYARVSQSIDISGFTVQIDAANTILGYGGYLRNYNGRDHPEMFARFVDGNGDLLGETEPVGTLNSQWTLVSHSADIPPDTRRMELVLVGTRNAGSDNDSYFDDVYVHLTVGNRACDPAPLAPPEPDGGVPDAGPQDANTALIDAAAPRDGGMPSMSDSQLTDGASTVRDGGMTPIDTASDAMPATPDAMNSPAGNERSSESGCACSATDPSTRGDLIFAFIFLLGARRFWLS